LRSLIDRLAESSEGVSRDAQEFVGRLTSSGGPVAIKKPSAKVLSLLKGTVRGNYHLYRGIGVIAARVPKDRVAEVNGLREGDQLPGFLNKAAVYNQFASYSKKKSVARTYAEGRVSILVEAKVAASSVVVDLMNIDKVMPGVFSKDDLEYFKFDKEVIVLEPVGAKILSVKGSL